MEIKFNEELHEYSVEGTTYPSVTQVLPKINFYCTKAQLEHARQDGIETHSKIKLFLDTRKTYGDPILEAFEDWLLSNESLVGQPVKWEHPMVSSKHKFAGTPDIIFEKALVDVKRSFQGPRRHSLQTAGYNILTREAKILDTKIHLIVYPDKGVYKAVNVYNPMAEGIFLSCVKQWYLKQQINNYING